MLWGSTSYLNLSLASLLGLAVLLGEEVGAALLPPHGGEGPGSPFGDPWTLGRQRCLLTTWCFLCACMLSCVQLLVTPCTVTHQTPLFMEFFRQEYWSVLPFPPPRDLPNTGIKPTSLASPALQTDSLSLVSPGKPILLGGVGIVGSQLGLYWHLLSWGREVQVPFPCFCWGLMEVLVPSGWYCKFGFPLSLLWYLWVGQGRVPF